MKLHQSNKHRLAKFIVVLRQQKMCKVHLNFQAKM